MVDSGPQRLVKPRGDYARATMAAVERAVAMNTLSLIGIRDSFQTDSLVPQVDLKQVTFSDYMKALDTADRNGTRPEFEADLRRQLTEILGIQPAPPMAGQPAPVLPPQSVLAQNWPPPPLRLPQVGG